MSESKDEDLLKIQVVSENCHTIFTAKSSVIVGALIGFLVLFYTLLYNGTFSPLTFWLCFFGWSGVCVYYIRKISKEYSIALRSISDMIEKVKQGEALPPLKNLVDSTEKNKDEMKQEKPVNPNELSNNSKVSVKDLLLLIQGVLVAFILQIFYDTLRESSFYQNIAPIEVWRVVLAVICGILVLLIFRYFKKNG